MRCGELFARQLPLLCAAALAIAAVIMPPSAVFAGEVRVNVGASGLTFTDPITGIGHTYVNCNVGDHVVWVWMASLPSHTSTSGDTTTATPDRIWDSGFLTGAAINNGAAFSWKAAALGSFGYYCQPHWFDGMFGHVIVGNAIAVSDFRITEVQYNAAGGLDKIEITNSGAAAGDFGRYRISVGATAVSIAANSVPMSPGQTLTIHTNETAPNTATDLYLPALGALADAAGSVALYAPNTKPGTTLADATQIADYVEYGATGGANEATAITANVWTAGQSAPVVAVGKSIEFCGDATQHSGRWFENPLPNFGGAADNCVTPTRSISWGRIKMLYR